jgi:hypothetical protein
MKTRALVVLFLLTGCGANDAVLSGDELIPTADELASTTQELISCAASSDTGYRSGNSFPITLVTVDGKPSEIRTAQAYDIMQAAARRDGIFLSVVSGFRTMADQRRLYACYINCNCNSCNLAAQPGYSNHQSGSALDLNASAPGVYSWLARNAARFGFENTVASENWHWELVGTPPAGGACGTNEPPQELAFDNLKPNGWYTNGVWMRVVTPSTAAIVRYSSNGFSLGDSENRADDFAVRYIFSTIGDRTITAKAYDRNLKLIAEKDITIKVTAGDTSQGTIVFESPTPDGWFTNGVWFKTKATGGIAKVSYSSGTAVLGSATDATAFFPVRYSFTNLGWRVVTAVGFDASGAEIARKSTVVKITP